MTRRKSDPPLKIKGTGGGTFRTPSYTYRTTDAGGSHENGLLPRVAGCGRCGVLQRTLLWDVSISRHGHWASPVAMLDLRGREERVRLLERRSL